MSKCFCHFNGYEVKDAKSRRDIENLSNDVNVEIQNLSNSVNEDIDRFKRNVDSKIVSMENSINNITTGTPLIASSIEEMTDTSRIYVNTTNGNWYYYKGNTWISGGVYQSSSYVIEDNSIIPTNIVGVEVLEDAKKVDMVVLNKYINVNGVDTPSASFRRTDYIEVKEGDRIHCPTARGQVITCYDENKTYLRHTLLSTASTQDFYYEVETDVKYIIFNMFTIDYDNYKIYINGLCIFDEYYIPWLKVDYNNNKWNEKRLIMFGDSLVSGVDTNDNYITRLQPKLNLIIANNQGVSGSCMTNGIQSGIDSTNTVINSLVSYNYDLVIIAAGTNDFRLNAPLGNKGQIGDTNFDTNTFYGAYRQAIEYILQKNLFTRICLWTPLQRDCDGYDVNYTNSAGHKLIDYVNAIKEIGEMYSIPVIDLYSNSGITKLNLSVFTRGDGLHLNAVGYDKVCDYAISCLKNI